MHSPAFRRRRFFNWAPLGLTYAFLYMGRYNLTVAKNALGDLMSLEQFGIIFGIGTITYGVSFLVNGPLTDRMGGRKAILTAALGSGIMNALLGWYIYGYIMSGSKESPIPMVSFLYSVNMYFQSFGAVAIVKVNSNWFHVTERGTFSAIFGAIISSGIFLAFDVGYRIVKATEGEGEGGVDATWWVFFVPAIMLGLFFIVDIFLVKNLPSDAGVADFDTGAAKIGNEDNDDPIPTMQLLKAILTNPIILTVAAIEFCSGVLRNGIMHWYPLYAKSELVLGNHFLLNNWGLILFVAGVSGGTFAGLVSDKLFQSRRGPAAGGLYFGMIVACVAMVFMLGGTKPEVGWIKSPVKYQTAAGLQHGDAILAVNSSPVADKAGLIAALGADEVTLKIVRDKKEQDLKLTLTDAVRTELAFADNLVEDARYSLEDDKKATGIVWRWNTGLHSGDLIVALDSKPITDRGRFVGATATNKAYDITVLRGGEPVNIHINLTDAGREALRWRKSLESIKDFEVAGEKRTVLHWKGAWAFEAGLRKGDAMTLVNGKEPGDWGDFQEQLKTDGTENVVVLTRNGTQETLRFVYAKYAPQTSEFRAKYIAAGPVQTLNPYVLGFLAFLISLCVIGSHGLLSGTATMDFGGKKGTATAVGVIDGFVYLGTGLQSFALGFITTRDWSYWPVFLVPFAFLGFLFCLRIWNAKPRSGGAH